MDCRSASLATEAEAAIADSREQSIANDGQAGDCQDDIIDARILQRCRKALREGALSGAALEKLN